MNKNYSLSARRTGKGGDNMRMEQLKYLLEVVSSGSISAAAKLI